MKKHAVKAESCPNCGQQLNGENFCPNCGQPNDARRISTRDFIRESLSNLFALDGRIAHTLHHLFRYPGRIPIEFIHGKRMQYMNPIRIYFISSLLLLFILQFDKDASMVEINNEVKEGVEDGLAESSVQNIAETESGNGKTDTATAEVPLPVSESEEEQFGKIERMMNFYEAHPDLPVETALDSMELSPNFGNKFLYAQAAKLADFDDEEFSRYFFSKLFWVLFLFLPILALLLNLLYFRRKYHYPEHLFFTFYSQSVFFILMSVSLLFYLIFDQDAILVIGFVCFAVYLFISLRKFYGQGFGKTLFKFILLNSLAVPVFVFFFVVAMMVAFVLF